MQRASFLFPLHSRIVAYCSLYLTLQNRTKSSRKSNTYGDDVEPITRVVVTALICALLFLCFFVAFPFLNRAV
jgi:hypothetical protein